MIDTIKYSLVGMIVLIFQWMLGDLFSIAGITPNFLVIFIIYMALNYSQIQSIWFGFIFGMILDALVSTQLMGLNALSLAVVGYLAGIFQTRIVRIPIILQYLLYLTILIIYYSLTILIYLQDSHWSVGDIFFLLLIPKTLYTLIILSGTFIVFRVGAE